VVCLPLGLSVVRRLDLSGQTKYFFIKLKERSKIKIKQQQQNKNIISQLKRREKERKKERKRERKKNMYK